MFFQNSRNLIEPIRRIGCEYLAILAYLELRYAQDFDLNQVNKIWTNLRSRGAVDDTQGLCTAESYISLIEYVSLLLDCPEMTGDQVANIHGGDIEFYSWYRNTHYDFAVRRYISEGNIHHSVLLSSQFETWYNSYPTLSRGKSYSIQLYVIGERGTQFDPHHKDS